MQPFHFDFLISSHIIFAYVQNVIVYINLIKEVSNNLHIECLSESNSNKTPMHDKNDCPIFKRSKIMSFFSFSTCIITNYIAT